MKLNAKSKTSNLETIAKFVKRIRKFARERYKGADRKVVQKGTPTRVASSRPRRKGRNSQVDLLPIPSSYPRYFNIGYGNKLRIDVKAASLPSSPLPLHATKTSSSCSLSHLYTSNLSPPFLLPLLFLLSLSVPFFRSVFPFLSLSLSLILSFLSFTMVHANRRGNIITLNDTRYVTCNIGIARDTRTIRDVFFGTDGARKSRSYIGAGTQLNVFMHCTVANLGLNRRLI